MKRIARFLVISIAVASSLMFQAQRAHAESESLSALSAQWWQWALSIPTSQNPLLDTTGANCMIGQHGSTWFLAGLFGGGGPVIRNCAVPDNVRLFFPVINSVNINKRLKGARLDLFCGRICACHGARAFTSMACRCTSYSAGITASRVSSPRKTTLPTSIVWRKRSPRRSARCTRTC
jgi:hypothetical protein